MNRLFKQFNLRDKKYALPLIFLPFLIFFIILFTKEDKATGLEQRSAISVQLGGAKDIEIGEKSDSYKKHRDLRGIDNQQIAGLSEEKIYKDSIYTAQNDERILDSLNNTLADLKRSSEQQRRDAENLNNRGGGYIPPNPNTQKSLAETRRKERELAELLKAQQQNEMEAERQKEEDAGDVAVRAMREQIMLMDSLDRMNNPERMAKIEQDIYQQKLREKKDFFLNSNLQVTKGGSSRHFNTTYKSEKSEFIKAVIDEDVKGYLGSRIRIRLLEDIYVGNAFLPKGSFLYSTIHGFGAQRVNLKIVSALINDEILPINLEIYDIDGMQGLYVPRSLFREISEELATQQMQGNQMSSSGENFYQSTASKLITSGSSAITALIKKHKAKVKYNTHLFLIDEKQLKEKRKDIYEKNNTEF